MNNRSKKRIPHTNKELITIAFEKNIKQEYHQKYIAFYNESYTEWLETYKDWDDDELEKDIKEEALESVEFYINPYIKAIENGHGEKWATLSTTYDDERANAPKFKYLSKKNFFKILII